MKKYLSLVLFLFVFVSLFTSVAFAQETTPTDNQVNAIAKQLFCPVCQNTPLDVCPTEACRQWRELIRQMLSEGKTEAEILQYFEDQYGPRVRQEPPRAGFSWLAYIIPLLVIAAGVFFLFRALKGWTKAPVAESASGGVRNDVSKKVSAQDDYVVRLEDELKKRK